MTSCEETSHRKAACGRVLSAKAGQQCRATEDVCIGGLIKDRSEQGETFGLSGHDVSLVQLMFSS